MPATPSEFFSERELSSRSQVSEFPSMRDAARKLARNHSVYPKSRNGYPLLAQINRQEEFLQSAYKSLLKDTRIEISLSSVGDWLLDNFHVVQQAIQQIRIDMPAGYYQRLPKLDSGHCRDFPRVLILAREIIDNCQGPPDIDRIKYFIRAYQGVTALTMGELWALPTMLRLMTLEYLAQEIALIIGIQFTALPLGPALPKVSDLADQVGPGSADTNSAERMANEESIANCVLSLHMLAASDWEEFFESLSHVEHILRSDPADIYARMDFKTRDRYRNKIEALAQALELNEVEIAQKVVEIARGNKLASGEEINNSASSRTSHVGFYLIDAGRVQFEVFIGFKPSLAEQIRRFLLAHPALVFLSSVTLLTSVIILVFAAYAVFVDGSMFQIVIVSLLLILPASALAIDIANRFFTRILPPRTLPRMDFEEGIPAAFMTFVVIPSLLGDGKTIRSLLDQMELHYLSNPDPQLRFALLTDFIDAPQEIMPEDAELIENLREGIQALNIKYGHDIYTPFYLFQRRRLWNPKEDSWMGWERKRGKLSEFNQLLAGSLETSYFYHIGDLSVLPSIKFVITLDSDTALPKGSAYRLISTLAHPLNRAEFDSATGKVVTGYSILQPRIQIKPSSADRSLFTRVFSSDTNLDLYSRAVSDIYQDLFREGSYVGKGIYDPVALERSVSGRIPENMILSHDLIEGILARTALVTDIALFEDFPPHYLASAQRMHRWIRGDWQLLPWLMPGIPHTVHGSMRNDLSALDRWKIFDNLRRSILEPAVLLLLLAGWCWLPGSAFVWTAAALMRYFLLIPISLFTNLGERKFGGVAKKTLSSLGQASLRSLLAITFLSYEALIRTDAVVTTLVRLFITHQRLLQWTTAAHTIRFFGRQLKTGVIWRKMISVPISAIGFGVLIVLLNPHTLPAALPLLFLWFVAPQITQWINRSLTRKTAPVSKEQALVLRSLARRTWLFFEHFVGPDDHWLPPDHFQEDPLGRVAHRTSPTNIGLLLLSTLAAYDMGYIGPLELSLRLSDTFDGMDGLERYRGHLLNWYDTRLREPLPPRYVSTVDSGNLAGCMLALKQGCQDVIRTPVLRGQFWQGFLDTMNLLINHVGEIDNKPATKPLADDLLHIREQVVLVQGKPDQWASLLVRLCDEEWEEIGRSLMSLVEQNEQDIDSESLNNLHVWYARTRTHIANTRWELDLLMPWLETFYRPPAVFWTPGFDADIEAAWQSLQEVFPDTPCLDEIADICEAGAIRVARLQELLINLNHSADQINLAGGAFPATDVAPAEESDISHEVQEALAWCRCLAVKLDSARAEAESLHQEYRQLSSRVEKEFQDMDFGFLYDHERQVFHIGYNVETGKLDNNHYDLLASEARITSLLAIAKGDVPLSHWLHLSRPFTRVGNTGALLSWSGTAFEYLMPTLIMRSYQNTLLGQSTYAAVSRQIDYGHQKGVPWGISESGYYHFDNNFNYQYRAFGVPGLGFKRGLADDLVVSPYATILALAVNPHAVLKNIEHLTRLNMLGAYGFYEALDFTPSRLSIGQNHARVSSYMAHHQGMMLLSLTNFLEHEIMIDRFHADKRVQSVDLLLQERIPGAVSIEYPHPEEVGIVPRVRVRKEHKPWFPPIDSPIPQVHYLSNGRYSVLITSAGSGFSRWKGVDLTRWRADTTLDNWGTWIYVKDLETGNLWSAGCQPTGSDPETREIRFYPHSAVLQRRDHDISLRMEIFIPPEDDVEIRQITLINHASHARRIKLTSYAEVVLDAQNGDRRHPVFNQLFIESEYVPDRKTLLFNRRPRSADEEPVFFAHSCTVEEAGDQPVAFESNRSHFLGRGGTCRSPAAFQNNGTGLTNTCGATLDPAMALAIEIEIEAHATQKAAYIFCAASTRHEALTLAQRYQDWGTILRTSNQARFHSDQELARTELTSLEIERFQTLLSALLYPHAGLRAPASILQKNCSGQSDLWKFAISGDNPILLVRVSNTDEISLVRELLLAHKYWRNREIAVDLVIINMREVGYEQDLSNQLYRLLSRTSETIRLNQRGGIFLLRADQMEENDLILIETAARVFLDAKDGSLSKQLKKIAPPPVLLPQFVSTSFGEAEELSAPALPRPANLLFDNSLGGFSPDGKEYVLYLKPGQQTPAPWTNVIAYPHFGFLTTESGMGCTWAENSGENRLTPWNNDPVSDTPGEAVYLRDETTGAVWSPTPLPARSKEPYLIRHGAGYSIFEHHSNGLKQRMRLFAVPDAPVKIVQLRITNTWNLARRITATYFAEWVLGTTRETMGPYIVPQFDAANSALLASNPYSPEFKERIAFLAASREVHAITTDRTEFLGSRGSYTHPAALNRVGLTARVTAGIDSCAAIQILLWLAPGEEKEVTFLLGQGADQEEALRLIHKYREMPQINQAWTDVQDFWNERLDAVTVKTPDPAMDLMLNRWLLYQALSCRVWGRSAFYQSSGAFGFRDQLQDVMAMVHTDPGVTRGHILESARHQFEAGDVLHWWHPPASRGVRTRCSDDLLWLPYVTAHYITATGDVGILDEQIPFLKGDPLQEEELDRYGLFEFTENGETLYEHCRRAIEKGITAGVHGLPLIGSHDWNDGMNRVGIDGRGESVWLGWFLYSTLIDFAVICERIGDENQAQRYRRKAGELQRAIEKNAWDGSWYLRAFYDDGTPLGSSSNLEARIDSIAQSWAVLSGAADPDRSARAMQSVVEELVRAEDQILLLFTPPFDKTKHDPGYIKGYIPGIRENGGQYTHAAIWAVWAFAKAGQGDRAEALFRLLNPIYHADTIEKVHKYRVEPYVVAADVYSVSPNNGRGGWTWYTGSASWMYRLGLEGILGLSREGDHIRIDPSIPGAWSDFKITLRNGSGIYHIRVENPEGICKGVRQIIMDGTVLEEATFPLCSDGKEHNVRVLMGEGEMRTSTD